MIKKSSFFFFLFCLSLGLIHPSISSSQNPDKYIILNLHWDSETIRLNTMHSAQGVLKKNRRSLNKNQFMYRIVSIRREVIKEGYFEVPRFIHCDYVDSEKNQLQGGMLPRRETDFVVKIPVLENYQRILFYRLKGSSNTGIQTTTVNTEEQLEDMIGEVELR